MSDFRPLCPPPSLVYVPEFAPDIPICSHPNILLRLRYFHRKQPKKYLQYTKGAPILVTNFADFKLWTEFHLMKIRMFFLGPLPTKDDIRTQKWFKPLHIHNGMSEKSGVIRLASTSFQSEDIRKVGNFKVFFSRKFKFPAKRSTFA